jgi:hypothetical protein
MQLRALCFLLLARDVFAMVGPQQRASSPRAHASSAANTGDGATRRQASASAAAAAAAAALAPTLSAHLQTFLAASAPLQLGTLATADVALLTEGDAIIRSLWLGRLAYPAVVAALEIGLFEALSQGPLHPDTLGRRVSPPLPPRALEALTATCAALGLLRFDSGQRLALAPSVRPYLVRESPRFWGPQLLAADGTHSSLRRALHRASHARRAIWWRRDRRFSRALGRGG